MEATPSFSQTKNVQVEKEEETRRKHVTTHLDIIGIPIFHEDT